MQMRERRKKRGGWRGEEGDGRLNWGIQRREIRKEEVDDSGEGKEMERRSDPNEEGCMGSVLDLVSQVRDVVLMNVYLDLGNSGRSGFWNGGYMSQGREMRS
jgi:hypothetical protein